VYAEVRERVLPAICGHSQTDLLDRLDGLQHWVGQLALSLNTGQK